MSSRTVRDALVQDLRARSQQGTTGIAYLQQLIAARAGLNLTDLRAASALVQDGPMTAGALQKRLRLTGGAATTAVDRLEKKGIATRASDPHDRRKVTISVNPTALQNIQPIYDTIDRAFDEVLARYSDDELTVLIRYFEDTIRLTELLIAQLETPESPGRPS
jgi:MarR family transcriptional regulator, organic hydroperoxide resistance regulator